VEGGGEGKGSGGMAQGVRASGQRAEDRGQRRKLELPKNKKGGLGERNTATRALASPRPAPTTLTALPQTEQPASSMDRHAGGRWTSGHRARQGRGATPNVAHSAPH
jgi:hypothetical protein